MNFEFITDKTSAGQVLRLWNICLLGAIPCTPEKLNQISSFLNASGVKNDKRSVSTRREKKPDVKRSGSFSKSFTLGVGGSLARGSGGLLRPSVCCVSGTEEFKKSVFSLLFPACQMN